MKRDQLLSMIRLQMEQEQKRGIGYWCDPRLADALRKATEPPAAGASTPPYVPIQTRPAAVASTPRHASVERPPVASASMSQPRRYAKPPERLNPDAPPVKPKSPATKSGRAAMPKWDPPPTATGRDADWVEQLAGIEKEVKVCTGCSLSETRTNTVYGVGEATVPLVFIGEAPGAEEDRQGIPFVGRAGALLTRIIEAMGLKREQVYIMNVLKCRPPGNRDPLPDEVATCSPFLDRQLAILKPKVICTLGRHSTLRLTGEAIAMKALHGREFEYRGHKVVPTYHPAALLRNPSLKALVWEDVQKVRRLLDA